MNLNMLDKIDEVRRDFHAHLDKCHQCEQHPFGLCADGRDILERLTIPVPDDSRRRRHASEGER